MSSKTLRSRTERDFLFKHIHQIRKHSIHEGNLTGLVWQLGAEIPNDIEKLENLQILCIDGCSISAEIELPSSLVILKAVNTERKWKGPSARWVLPELRWLDVSLSPGIADSIDGAKGSLAFRLDRFYARSLPAENIYSLSRYLLGENFLSSRCFVDVSESDGSQDYRSAAFFLSLAFQKTFRYSVILAEESQITDEDIRHHMGTANEGSPKFIGQLLSLRGNYISRLTKNMAMWDDSIEGVSIAVDSHVRIKSPHRIKSGYSEIEAAYDLESRRNRYFIDLRDNPIKEIDAAAFNSKIVWLK